jgi:ribonucleotide reductase beta subunit family protein with ferritin-like domain
MTVKPSEIKLITQEESPTLSDKVSKSTINDLTVALNNHNITKMVNILELKETKCSSHENDAEPLLTENRQRFVLFPIKYEKIWKMYKKHEASFWTAEEIDLSSDYKDWSNLNKNEQHFIKNILAFFASSDGIVMENLAKRFMNDVKIPEARSFYGFQLMMENIHSETYGLLIETYITDDLEKAKL